MQTSTESRPYPKLTTEEFQAFLQDKKEFYDFYDIKFVPLYKRVASALHHLATCKAEGLRGKAKDLQEATTHYLKACLYNPEQLSYEATRATLGI